ncbi:MAG: hypothetical protein IPF70_08590 [Saprospiraceae bacterium]|nr:hypothetical protein [Saprospiraceae bacterium]
MASFIPRIFWPDKPTSGGKANMKYYANVFLDTTSMDVGPIGEGYGSFGKWGGILYMFFFGSFLSLSFRYFISLCKKYPLLIFWQPLVFYEVIYCMENDTMQAMNSLIKIGIILFILFEYFPILSGHHTRFLKNHQQIEVHAYFIEWYTPANLAGGPIQSVQNIVSHLSNQCKSGYIQALMTLGDNKIMKNIQTNPVAKSLSQ